MANANPTTLRLAGETSRKTFSLVPNAEARSLLANELNLISIKKLKFEGEIVPDGETDWQLDAMLGATVVQSCVATLEPVTTRIDGHVFRRFVAVMPNVEDATEVEMPEDDTLEPLTDVVDLERVMSEALALSLPDFPRAAGLDPVEMSVTEPGKTAMTDQDAKPFAGLADLKKSLEGKGEKND